MKRCFKCGKTKPLDEFYTHPAMADGRLGKCRECACADVRANRAENIARYRKFDRARAMLPHRVAARKAYAQTPAGKRARRVAEVHYRSGDPRKYRAHYLVSNAIRDGRLVRRPCERCGNPKSEAHHDDYALPLAVQWLCKVHHREADRKRRKG